MPAKTPNRLIHASSPYLLQHAWNPVDWFPWGAEALQKAQAENKLLIVSIGYAACHWCHVMEHESFEDEPVAQLMNTFFISVKVDREERPDVDQVYMNAAYLSTGRGGWPLNAIALPDGRPVFAGTYFPKTNWVQVLQHFVKLWKEHPADLEELAGRVKEGIRQIDHEPFAVQPASGMIAADNEAMGRNILSFVDFQKGGLDKSPKFPMPSVWQYLLRYHYHTQDAEALQAVEITLNAMMNGGIYDIAGGGFARYSTDDEWFAPHFEKMLYDNGQLVSLYAEAYRVTGNRRYIQVVEETLAWTEREMLSEEGGFYASLDADSEGKEGKFYTWSKKEIETLLEKDAAWFCEYFGITEEGNWEHTNILAAHAAPETLRSFPLSSYEWEEELRRCLNILLAEREKRVRPGLDDKILTSWNAIMLKGYTDAWMASGNPYWLETAEKNAAFISEKLAAADHRLFRNYKDGVASIPGFLDDYAFYIDALIALYQATFNESYLLEAKAYTETVLQFFYEPEEKVFYYSPSDFQELIVRTKEMSDNVIPASNSAMAKNLYVLGKYFARDEWTMISETLCRQMLPATLKQAAYHANWAQVCCMHIYGMYEMAFCGLNRPQNTDEAMRSFMPDILRMSGNSGTQLPLLQDKIHTNGIYICKDKVCQAPVNSLTEALQMVRPEKGPPDNKPPGPIPGRR